MRRTQTTIIIRSEKTMISLVTLVASNVFDTVLYQAHPTSPSGIVAISKPRISFPFFRNVGCGPHAAMQRQHVFDVKCSGVIATTKRLDSFFISPTPMHGGFPLLHAELLRPAMAPQLP